MLSNPLLWLHLRIAGNPRSNLWIALLFAAAVLGFSTLTYSLPDGPPRATLDAVWLGIVTAAQAVFLLVLAPAAVRRSVQRDVQTGMIESHRISPMSNLRIVLGYLSGAPIQAFILYGTALALGVYFASRYGASIGTTTRMPSLVAPGSLPTLQAVFGGWGFLQLQLLDSCFMLCSVVLLTAIATGGKANPIGVLVIAGVFGGWVAVIFVPGLALLTGVMSGGALLQSLMSGTVKGDMRVLSTSMIFQAVFGVLFTAAACGRLRRPEHAVFALPLSLALLAVTAACLVAGIALLPGQTWMRQQFSEQGSAKLVASAGTFMLVATLAVLAAAIERYRTDRALAFGAPLTDSHGTLAALMPPILSVGAFLTLVQMYKWMDPSMLAGGSQRPWTQAVNWVAAFAAFSFSFWADYNLFYSLRARNTKLVVVTLLWLGLIKVLPIAADGAIYASIQNAYEEPWQHYGYLAALSPVGTLASFANPRAMWIGLAFQAVLAAVVTLGARRARLALGYAPGTANGPEVLAQSANS